ncbi:MAG TPA: DNA-binding protein [Patescibacteria group bacterium]|nr:DNA-binding protein [Patescibacteria group bacterium]
MKKQGYFGPRETAVRTGRTIGSVYRQLYEGKWPGAVKHGGRWAIPAEAIEQRLRGRANGR